MRFKNTATTKTSNKNQLVTRCYRKVRPRVLFRKFMFMHAIYMHHTHSGTRAKFQAMCRDKVSKNRLLAMTLKNKQKQSKKHRMKANRQNICSSHVSMWWLHDSSFVFSAIKSHMWTYHIQMRWIDSSWDCIALFVEQCSYKRLERALCL